MRTLAVTKVTLFGTFFLFWFEEVDCNNGDGESSHTSVWGDIRPPRGNTELAKNTRENIKFQEAYARYFIIPHLSEVLKNVCKRLFCGLKPPTRARLVLFQLGRRWMMRRWNMNFVIFCHGPTLVLAVARTLWPGPPPDLLSLCTIWLPLIPPLHTSTWPLSWPHAGITADISAADGCVHTLS